jgi:hypothetical protein
MKDGGNDWLELGDEPTAGRILCEAGPGEKTSIPENGKNSHSIKSCYSATERNACSKIRTGPYYRIADLGRRVLGSESNLREGVAA